MHEFPLQALQSHFRTLAWKADRSLENWDEDHAAPASN